MAEAAHAGPHEARTLDLDVVLPEAGDERDACVHRLVEELEARDGVHGAHVEARDEGPVLCLHYDPDEVPFSAVERAAADAGAQVSRRYGHDRFWVRGMDCGDCAASIAHVLERREGVLGARGNYAAERVWVEWDGEATTRDEVVGAIEAMGYHVDEGDDHEPSPLVRDLAQGLVGALALAAGLLGELVLGWPAAASTALYGLAYVVAGYQVAWHGAQAARNGRLDIDVLMVVAALGAAAVGRPAEGAFLLVLFELGHALEHRATERARGAVRGLADLAPETARVRRDGVQAEVPVEDLQRGEVVVVRPGERIPVDGTVESGRSAVDESPVTGESVPADKAPGDDVYAGTLNQEGALEVEVTALARDSTLARVVEMVEEAQARKGEAQRFSERFESRLVPAVLVLAAAVILVPPLAPVLWPGSALAAAVGLPWRAAVLRGMAVLVAASPCALAISTPSAVLSAVAGAARRGILVKGGAHLEDLAEADAVALDKTGTLTRGAPEVVAVAAGAGRSQEEVLRLAGAVEAFSDHPLARAVVEACRDRGLDLPEARETEALPGRGVEGRIDGERVRVGSPALVGGADALPGDLAAALAEHQEAGRTAVVVEADGEAVGIVALADRPREGAADAVAALRGMGLHVALLTGDGERVARAVGDEVGIDDVRAGLLPEEKVEAVDDLARDHGTVVMVGDGVNDGPALARAHVGVAMGARGSDVALETADVALMGDDLRRLPEALEGGRRAAGVIRQNLAASLGVIAVLVPLAALGIAGVGPAIVLHEGSTLAVVGNALRLLRPG